MKVLFTSIVDNVTYVAPTETPQCNDDAILSLSVATRKTTPRPLVECMSASTPLASAPTTCFFFLPYQTRSNVLSSSDYRMNRSVDGKY